MKKWTTLAMLAALPATAAVAAVPYHSMPPGFEAPRIRTAPIAGVVADLRVEPGQAVEARFRFCRIDP